MSITIRAGRQDDLEAIVALDGASFGHVMTPEEMADYLLLLDPADFLVACDAGRIVGVTADYPFTMSLPGGAVDVRGVTWVSVDVTHRRRGVLRELMRAQLDAFRSGGGAAAVLNASESGIYGRFGYGVASVVRKTEIQRRRVALLTPGDPLAVQRMPKDEARKRLPDIHDRWRAQTPGALSRSDAWWEVLTHDLEVRRSGMSPLFYLVHDDGYVSYRVKTDWSDGDPRHLCWIEDYAIVTPQAHRDLWQVLLGLDLVGTIESYRIPVDDPLPYVVNDGRQVRTTHIGDGLWLRPLDVPALLSARRYAVEVDVTIGVRDVLLGDGVYRLTGAADGASCVPADGEPDVTLDVGTLGALALGGMRVLPLAEAGRISAADDVLTRLDRALLADRAPAHGTNF